MQGIATFASHSILALANDLFFATLNPYTIPTKGIATFASPNN